MDLSSLMNNVDKVYYFDGEVVNHDLNEVLDDFEIVSPIMYRGEIVKLEGSNIINVNINYKYKTRCDRCLKDAINKVQTSLSGKLKDYGDASEKEEENEEDVIYHNKGFLNLDKYIVMEVASSLPMKSLCSEDCKGICQQCGLDLNEGSCDCTGNIIDPRLEKLKDFKIED
ncbi:MAG TPA: DUF177 domain-containing protein [Tissierellaceae bacterium]|nr:DUF177 domain-containing protein [Tissierellaceae bacterium]